MRRSEGASLGPARLARRVAVPNGGFGGGNHALFRRRAINAVELIAGARDPDRSPGFGDLLDGDDHRRRWGGCDRCDDRGEDRRRNASAEGLERAAGLGVHALILPRVMGLARGINGRRPPRRGGSRDSNETQRKTQRGEAQTPVKRRSGGA